MREGQIGFELVHMKISVGREESYAIEFIEQTLTIFIQARLGPNSTHAEASAPSNQNLPVTRVDKSK